MVLTPDGMAVMKQSFVKETPVPRSILQHLFTYNVNLNFLSNFEINPHPANVENMVSS